MKSRHNFERTSEVPKITQALAVSLAAASLAGCGVSIESEAHKEKKLPDSDCVTFVHRADVDDRSFAPLCADVGVLAVVWLSRLRRVVESSQ